MASQASTTHRTSMMKYQSPTKQRRRRYQTYFASTLTRATSVFMIFSSLKSLTLFSAVEIAVPTGSWMTSMSLRSRQSSIFYLHAITSNNNYEVGRNAFDGCLIYLVQWWLYCHGMPTRLEPNSTTRTPATNTTNGQKFATPQHLDMSRCWALALRCGKFVVELLLWARPLMVSV